MQSCWYLDHGANVDVAHSFSTLLITTKWATAVAALPTNASLLHILNRRGEKSWKWRGKNWQKCIYFPVCLPATPLLTILKMESTNENGEKSQQSCFAHMHTWLHWWLYAKDNIDKWKLRKMFERILLHWCCKPGSIDDHAIRSTNGNVEKNVGKGVLLTCIPGPIVAHASIVLESIKSETKGG